ncbi:hypothetical protein JCM11641_002869 [Rhodosporidiobolus odoratus]
MENDQESVRKPPLAVPSLPIDLLCFAAACVSLHSPSLSPERTARRGLWIRRFARAHNKPHLSRTSHHYSALPLEVSSNSWCLRLLNKRVWAKSSYLKEVRAIQVGVQRLESSHSEADPFGAASVVVDFLNLLGQSPKLEELVLLGCMRLIDVVLDSSTALVRFLVRTRRLRLGGHFSFDPYHPSFLLEANRFPQLYEFTCINWDYNVAFHSSHPAPPIPRPSSLLTLDYATGVRGPSVIKPDGTLIFETSFGIELHPGWRIPYLGWNPEKLGPVTNRETCDFLISVRESPVEVDGSIFEALEVYADYEEEVAIMQRCRVALQQGRVMRSLEQLEAFEEEEANKAKEAAKGESGEDVEDEDQDDGEDEDEE